MAQLIPDRWLSAESEAFGTLFGVTGRCFEAFERLTALNLLAMRFGLAETHETFARMCAAADLPEVLALPALLAPVGAAQALSYNRQLFEVMSDLQRGFAPRQPASAELRRSDSTPRLLAYQSKAGRTSGSAK